MNKSTLIRLALLAFAALIFLLLPSVLWAADVSTPITWQVERSRPAILKVDDVRRGESLLFEPQYLDHGRPVDLTGVWTVFFNYKPVGSTNVIAITGSVLNATNGTVAIPWTSANELTNNSYSWDITVTAASSTMNRAFGLMTFNPSVAYQSQTSTLQRIWVLDFAQVQLLNVGQAPFLSSYELNDVRAYIASIENGSGDVHARNVQVDGTLTYTNWPTYLARTSAIPQGVISNIINGGSAASPTITQNGGNVTIVFPTGGGGGSGGGLSGNSWSSTGAVTIAIASNSVVSVDTNGITILQGTLQLYQSDLNCNVRIYDGSRLNPSLTPAGHPGTIGMYVRGYNGGYAYGFAYASQDVALVHAGGIMLMNTNATFNGNGSGLSRVPETLFAAFATNPIVPFLTVTNSGALTIKDVGGTTRFAVDGMTGAATIRGQDSDARYELMLTNYLFSGIRTAYTHNAAGTVIVTNIISYTNGHLTGWTQQ